MTFLFCFWFCVGEGKPSPIFEKHLDIFSPFCIFTFRCKSDGDFSVGNFMNKESLKINKCCLWRMKKDFIAKISSRQRFAAQGRNTNYHISSERPKTEFQFCFFVGGGGSFCVLFLFLFFGWIYLIYETSK